MTPEEFSSAFDTLTNSFASQPSFGETAGRQDLVFDEYEKSLFLTRFQEELVVSLYTGRNPSLQSFEETEELRRYLSDLIVEAELSPSSSLSGKSLGVDSDVKGFKLPSDLWFITYESALVTDGKCSGSTTLEVVPVRQDEYHRIRKNPFRGTNDRRALRLDLSDGQVEIVSKYGVTSYYVRYLHRLKPIILAPLDDQRIENEHEVSGCELPEYLHQRVLEGAVRMAMESRGVSLRNNREV